MSQWAGCRLMAVVRKRTRLWERGDIPKPFCTPSFQVCLQLQLLKQPNLVSCSHCPPPSPGLQAAYTPPPLPCP